MKITVIGAGNSGLAMAAHLSYFGNSVSLWNRSESTIQKLLNTKTIKVSGVINDTVTIDNVTTDLSLAIKDSDLILITTPASSHSDLASMLAERMTKSIPIVLNPGRTFGALNFFQSFRKSGGKITPIVAETQTIIYTCRKNSEDDVSIYSLKRKVKLATLKGYCAQSIINVLPDCIRCYYSPADSFLETSLGNVGLVLHCTPFMLNTGWTECTTTDYLYYYDGITPTIGNFIQHIDDERIAIGNALGVRLESTMEWMKREYDTCGDSLYECIRNNATYKEIDAPKSIHHRYIFEDVPHGLVPFERIGLELNANTHYMSLAIDLANALVDKDFRLSMPEINLGVVKEYL